MGSKMSDKIHYKITVRGLVQGVFFRVSTKRKAQELGLTGFVHNQADGSVYIEVEGEQNAIDRLLAWLRAGGPSHARVDEVDINTGELQNMEMFEIR